MYAAFRRVIDIYRLSPALSLSRSDLWLTCFAFLSLAVARSAPPDAGQPRSPEGAAGQQLSAASAAAASTHTHKYRFQDDENERQSRLPHHVPRGLLQRWVIDCVSIAARAVIAWVRFTWSTFYRVIDIRSNRPPPNSPHSPHAYSDQLETKLEVAATACGTIRATWACNRSFQ